MLIEKGASPGRGLAYSTVYDCHLLNETWELALDNGSTLHAQVVVLAARQYAAG